VGIIGIVDFIIIGFIVLSAIILHEYAHGWSANQLGDPTAKLAGRLSLNPIRHIDPVGTLLIPGILLTMRYLGMNVFIFGWAKPVPVNFSRLRDPKRDMMIVGMAGPLVNIVLAVFLSLFLKLDISDRAYELMAVGIFVNLLLAIFNLIPVPPLDGSRLVMGLLPGRYAFYYSQLERYGIVIVVLLLMAGMFERIIFPLIILSARFLGVSL
jgi:Zn-dependent protease